ncbi:MAG: hydrogenase maturation nickel metallochaperone HypA [Deltaproteobacteria bacterium]|nr:hydrogenase maturation nickel metallochaperone HypA [Deltaproteobacteria bacterium]
MHELGIVQSILEIIEQQMEIHGAKKVSRVDLEFGAMTAVMPNAIEFAFQVLTKDSPVEGAELDIKILPIKAVCLDCHHEPVMETYTPFCPECSTGILNIIQGKDEMRIVSIEIE